MQATHVKEQFTNCNKHLSGYDLTTQLLRGGIGTLGLNGNAREVLLYLASCYNEKNGSVYPRVTTVAESLGISERGVIRALAELTNTGCIIRSKRGKNTNVYVITPKVLEAKRQDVTRRKVTRQDVITSSDTVSSSVVTQCHYHEHELKEHELKKVQLKEKNVVVVSFNKGFKGAGEEEALKEASSTTVSASSSKVNLDEIPAIIVNNDKVLNKVAYWKSLRPEIKQEYLDKQAELDKAEERKLQYQKLQEKEARRKEQEEKEFDEWSKLPLTKQFTKAQSIRQIWNMKKFPHFLQREDCLQRKLAVAYGLDIQAVFSMTKEEIESMS